MPTSPSTFLKRVGVWRHVPGGTDRYQSGMHHAHGEDPADTPLGEPIQSNWPEAAPDEKGVEQADTPT